MNKTIKSKKFGSQISGQQNVRIVRRTGFYHGVDFSQPLYTVAINNNIQANYTDEAQAIAHWERLVAGMTQAV